MDSTNELLVRMELYVAQHSGKKMRSPAVTSEAVPSGISTPAPNYTNLSSFYLTTAINYTNGAPHFGHAYEAILSDVITRYHRACGRKVFFLTGTDEHGQKVQKSAEASGKSPQAHCDFYAAQFQAMDELLMIAYDRFVRTTDASHKETARKMWQLVQEKDLYLSSYEGWYNKYEEEYVSNAEVLKLKKHPTSGAPMDAFGRELERKASEECFYFRMSKYADRLRAHIEQNPHFIQPPSCRAEIVSFLTNNVLEDLCVSRTSISWGVAIPDEAHAQHVMYVWFDALTNYLTGVNALSPEKSLGFWPAQVHIVGKDIIRFHTVYWPTMLMAANLPLPECVFGHGFVTDKVGLKMSKSLGNVRDPLEVCALYGVDAFRYYLARTSAFGWDIPYNEDLLVNNNNDILLKGFGNLVQRSYRVCVDCQSSELGEVCIPSGGKDLFKSAFDLNALKANFETCFSVFPSSAEKGEDEEGSGCGLRVRDAIQHLEAAVHCTNVFVDEFEPWKHKTDLPYREACARSFLQHVFVLAHFYRFFCPQLADRVVKEILCSEFVPALHELTFTSLLPGTRIRSSKHTEELILVNQLKVGEGKQARAKTGAEIVKQREEERMQNAQRHEENKTKKTQARQAQVSSHPLDVLNVRVGQIIRAEAVPNCKLIKEVVLVGNEEVTVCSGIGEQYTAQELVGKRVLIVLNLEPFTPKQLEEEKFVSHGLLLTAKQETGGEQLELLMPPLGASLGERMVPSTSSKNESDVPIKATDKQWSKAKHAVKVVNGGLVISKDAEVKWVGARCGEECVPLVHVLTGSVS